MDASVTLKLDPREFDLIRKALETLRDEDKEISVDATAPPAARHAAKGQHVEVSNLLSRLR